MLVVEAADGEEAMAEEDEIVEETATDCAAAAAVETLLE